MRASLTTTALAAPFTSWGGKAGWVSAFGGGGLGGSEWPLIRASAERASKRKAILLRILDMYPNASSPVGSRLPDDASQHRIIDDRQVKLELSISPPKHAPHTAQRLRARDDARDDHVCGAARVERAVLSVPHSARQRQHECLAWDSVPHSARQRQHERLAWDDPNAETAKAEREMENFYESVYRETSDACAAGRGVGEKLKEVLSNLQEQQKVRDKVRDAARTKEPQEASRNAREEEEAVRADQEKNRQEADAMMADSDAAASVVADEKVGGAEKFVKDSTSTETLPSMPDSAASEEVVFEETGAPEASEKAPIELRKIFVGGLSFQTTEAELVVRTHPAHPPAPTIAHQTARMRSHAEMPPPRSNSRVPAGVLRAVRGN